MAIKGPFCTVTNKITEHSKELAATLLKKGIFFSEVSEKYKKMVEWIKKDKVPL